MNIRPATKDDVQFLKKMLYEAARWNPDWPREPIEEVLADPVLVRYHQGWGRDGDGGVVAEVEGLPVVAVRFRAPFPLVLQSGAADGQQHRRGEAGCHQAYQEITPPAGPENRHEDRCPRHARNG